MDDQLAGLRTAAGIPTTMPKLAALAVTGGKGGVGKTCVAVNLAVACVKHGLRVLLVDLDLGLANADVLLGVDPAKSLHDVIIHGADPGSVICKTPSGVDLVPAASGREDLTALTENQHLKLFSHIQRLSAGYDLCILDTAAGIGGTVMAALRAARAVLVVLTPDPTSMTDAYAQIKVLESKDPGHDLRVVVNQSGSHAEGVEVFNRLRKVAKAYLKRDLSLIGQIPRDRAVTDAVRSRRPFAGGDSNGPAAQAMRQLAVRIKGERWNGAQA